MYKKKHTKGQRGRKKQENYKSKKKFYTDFETEILFDNKIMLLNVRELGIL